MLETRLPCPWLGGLARCPSAQTLLGFAPVRGRPSRTQTLGTVSANGAEFLASILRLFSASALLPGTAWTESGVWVRDSMLRPFRPLVAASESGTSRFHVDAALFTVERWLGVSAGLRGGVSF